MRCFRVGWREVAGLHDCRDHACKLRLLRREENLRQLQNVVDGGDANGRPAMRNNAAAEWINNVRESIEAFISTPADVDNVGMPGELAATQFILTPALDNTRAITNDDNGLNGDTGAPVVIDDADNDASASGDAAQITISTTLRRRL